MWDLPWTLRNNSFSPLDQWMCLPILISYPVSVFGLPIAHPTFYFLRPLKLTKNCFKVKSHHNNLSREIFFSFSSALTVIYVLSILNKRCTYKSFNNIKTFGSNGVSNQQVFRNPGLGTETKLPWPFLTINLMLKWCYHTQPVGQMCSNVFEMYQYLFLLEMKSRSW